MEIFCKLAQELAGAGSRFIFLDLSWRGMKSNKIKVEH
jgi:hypothetical protein